MNAAAQGKRLLALALLLAAVCSSCATAEYNGYAGYHTYKKDKDAATRMAVLAFAFLPVMTFPLLYIASSAYKNNQNIHFAIDALGLSSLFESLDKILP